MAEETELTYEEALALKEDLAGRPAPPEGLPLEGPGEPPGALARIWRVTQAPDAGAAAALLNRPPRQGAGEASMTNLPNGRVEVYFFAQM
jgi:hypothetical protein